MKVEETKKKFYLLNNILKRLQKSHLRDLINDPMTNGTGETRNISIISDNEKVMLGYEIDDIINNFFLSFKNNYQTKEQITREGSEFKF